MDSAPYTIWKETLLLGVEKFLMKIELAPLGFQTNKDARKILKKFKWQTCIWNDLHLALSSTKPFRIQKNKTRQIWLWVCCQVPKIDRQQNKLVIEKTNSLKLSRSSCFSRQSNDSCPLFRSSLAFTCKLWPNRKLTSSKSTYKTTKSIKSN